MAHRTRSFVFSYPVVALELVAALVLTPACKQDTSKVEAPTGTHVQSAPNGRSGALGGPVVGGARPEPGALEEVAVADEVEVMTSPASPEPLQMQPHSAPTGRKAGAPLSHMQKAKLRAAGPKEAKEMVLAAKDDATPLPPVVAPELNTGRYAHVTEQPFTSARVSPLSTFSIDVDTASYSNVRRLIHAGQTVDPGAVRVEEMINYFNYEYPEPDVSQPFSVTTEVSRAPWAPEHQLVLVGLQGRHVATEALPPRNLVFLLDVSGSMEDENKLPLLKRSFSKLLDTLGERDRVAIVVYAGASGLVLPSTPASERRTIEAALERLSAGGSTNGASGIELAYQVALEHTVKGGINRVILATDGDFNVGTTSESALTELIEEKREHGVSLSVLGFGMGNYNDSTLERLADNGNGNYAYIDTLEEAHKVLVTEVSGTLLTIAKDVKIQVEFNPAVVGAYRLIGYDNRRLADRDFNDDRKDAGEIGAGHRVTALYEVLTPAQASKLSGVDPLKYQTLATSGNTNEMLTVKLRHKDPEAKHSQLQKVTVANRVVPLERASDNLRFASAVAAFGMYLRQSEHGGNSSPALALDLARGAVGEDRYGYRKEFIQLVSLSAGVNRQAIAR